MNQAGPVLITALLIGCMAKAVTDDPDFEKEKRLHQIYKTYNAAPTREEAWTGVLTGKTQTYSVQQGDTLWDLSDTLFGDSQFWPKVWSLNAGKIQNPHQITPGLNVQFTPGTTGEAPSLAVKPAEVSEPSATAAAPAKPEDKVDKTEAKAEAQPSVEEFQASVLSRADIPPEVPTAPAGKIPKSLPNWTYAEKQGAPLKINVEKIRRNFGNPEQPLSVYISDEKLQGIGTMSETELSQKTASDLQYVFVHLKEEATDRNLFVVREIGEIKDPRTGKTGYMIRVEGELEVLENVNSEQNIYRALVKNAIFPLEVGSQILRGTMPKFNTSDKNSLSAATASIVGGQSTPDARLFSTQALVFLSGEGLSEGQIYPIYRNQQLRNESTLIQENPKIIGRLKVLKVSNSFATAVILQASDDIVVGDVTSPQLIKR